MSFLHRKFTQILPRRARRLLAEWDARKRSLEHLDATCAAASLGEVDEEWRLRIDAVTNCSDNAHILRAAGAGVLHQGVIVMHNGLQVGALGYYGAGILNMLVENRGVHEPQEERAFGEILGSIPKGGNILELGAYWGFYSMWFLKEVDGGSAFLVEPNPRHIISGKQNFEMNGLNGIFESAYVGNSTNVAKDGTPSTTVDEIVARHRLGHISILHADIQGAEVEMLKGANRTLTSGLVDFLFISTHSEPLHRECLAMLEKSGFQILVSCDMEQTVSVDGIIVAKRNGATGPDFLKVEGNLIPDPNLETSQ